MTVTERTVNYTLGHCRELKVSALMMRYQSIDGVSGVFPEPKCKRFTLALSKFWCKANSLFEDLLGLFPTSERQRAGFVRTSECKRQEPSE